MDHIEMRALLEKHRSDVEKVGAALLDSGKKEEVISGLVALFLSVVTGVPALGGLAKPIFARAFAVPANVVLGRQIEEWKDEEEKKRWSDVLTDRVEVLLGQTLIQLIRSGHGIAEGLEEALGGLRDDLSEFRADVAIALAATSDQQQADLRIAVQNVLAGGVGVKLTVRVSSAARRSVFIDVQNVHGVGIEM